MSESDSTQADLPFLVTHRKIKAAVREVIAETTVVPSTVIEPVAPIVPVPETPLT